MGLSRGGSDLDCSHFQTPIQGHISGCLSALAFDTATLKDNMEARKDLLYDMILPSGIYLIPPFGKNVGLKYVSLAENE